MAIRKVIEFRDKVFPAGSFRAHVLMLMTGAGIAQGISVLSAPVLTRLYTPSDFGLLALFVSVTYVVVAFSTVSYELAIILPEGDEEAINLVVLSLGLVAVVSVLSFFVAWIMNAAITDALKNPLISSWLYFVSVSVFFIGIFQVLNCWFNRKKRYKKIAVRQIMKSGGMVATQISLGLMHVGGGGLITGLIVGHFIAAGKFISDLLKDDWKLIKSVNYLQIWKLAQRFSNFPCYSFPAGLISTLTVHIPLMILAVFFNSQVVGSFALAEAVLLALFSVISTPFLTVFNERASSDYSKSGDCRPIYLKTLKTLCWLGLLPLAVIVFFAPYLFVFIFGAQWKEAGEYAQILGVMFYLYSLENTLGYTFNIAGKQKYEFVWNIALCILVICSLLIGGVFKNPKACVIFYTIVFSVMRGVHLYMSYAFAKEKNICEPV